MSRESQAKEVIRKMRRGGFSESTINDMERSLNMTGCALSLVEAVVLCTVVNYSKMEELDKALRSIPCDMAQYISFRVSRYDYKDMARGEDIFREVMFEARRRAEDFCGVHHET